MLATQYLTSNITELIAREYQRDDGEMKSFKPPPHELQNVSKVWEHAKKEGYRSDKDRRGENCNSSRRAGTPSAFQQEQIRAVKEKVKKAKKDGQKRSMKTTFAEYAFDHQPELHQFLTRTMWFWDPGWTHDIALRTCGACGHGDLFENERFMLRRMVRQPNRNMI